MTLKEKIHKQAGNIRANLEVADIAFVSLRIIIFCGGLGWLLFSDNPSETLGLVEKIGFFFAAYSVLIYIWLLLSPEMKKSIYGFALIFDLLFASLLVRQTGGFGSSFFNGFYLVTALYTFYYGLTAGIGIAAIAAVAYFLSSSYGFYELHWTDFLVRISFLFLLAVPLGMLSQKLKNDKLRIETLNDDLQKNLDELREVQVKLIQTEKLSALGRLTADVAHEIRNPLTSIGGFARRLNKKLLQGSREKEYSDIVVAEVDRLERILRDVLSFSRETKYNLEYQGINTAIKEALSAFYGICKEQSIELEEKLDSSLPEILIDRDQVRQAVNNLLSNAVDVMSKGGKLTVKTYMEELHDVDYIVVEVNDTGPGLPVEALNLIFDPFYTTKEIGAGSGLGLSICKKIIDDHNGLIFADSTLGQGTSFKMYFPYQSVENGKRTKCWEFTKCGVEKSEGAAHMRCPAYPNYGRVCWAIAGTFCGKKVSGAIAQKLGNCKKCEFYQRIAVRKDV
ncbi:MAG: sensor histidine kinase [Nitrospirae bacterium]|nr:sensor histidine kinase [Nitrospirota bacterium]